MPPSQRRRATLFDLLLAVFPIDSNAEQSALRMRKQARWTVAVYQEYLDKGEVTQSQFDYLSAQTATNFDTVRARKEAAAANARPRPPAEVVVGDVVPSEPSPVTSKGAVVTDSPDAKADIAAGDSSAAIAQINGWLENGSITQTQHAALITRAVALAAASAPVKPGPDTVYDTPQARAVKSGATTKYVHVKSEAELAALQADSDANFQAWNDPAATAARNNGDLAASEAAYASIRDSGGIDQAQYEYLVGQQRQSIYTNHKDKLTGKEVSEIRDEIFG